MASEHVLWGGDISEPLLRNLILWQLRVLLPTVALLAMANRVLALSVLLGGLAFAIPQSWFAWYVLRSRGKDTSSRQVTRRFYSGELQKLVMTGALCALVFALVRPLNAAGFFLAFSGMMILGWVVSARLARGTDRV